MRGALRPRASMIQSGKTRRPSERRTDRFALATADDPSGSCHAPRAPRFGQRTKMGVQRGAVDDEFAVAPADPRPIDAAWQGPVMPSNPFKRPSRASH
ncbi:hypothetical protein QWZ10_24785 [Paracoccus cavernae]|uniref:Uncharacterized protein n=1 Tax=Paracoccus cavernae TaxID=1571207 RepID=A0ABT8DBN3_9RHOB|nr:hypothetical protein [Paracoccus cavernae]